jgi:hypothetical protein
MKSIVNWSNMRETLRHKIQRIASEVLEPANNSLINYLGTGTTQNKIDGG